MRRGGMPWVKAWTKATRFLGSMRSHRSPIIRGHRHAGPSPMRPPAAAQIRVICARSVSAVREAYPQEASKFAKVVERYDLGLEGFRVVGLKAWAHPDLHRAARGVYG